VGARQGCPSLLIGRIHPTRRAIAMRRALHELICCAAHRKSLGRGRAESRFMAKVPPGPCISFVRACRGSRCRVGPSKTSALLGGRRRCADSPPSRTRSPGLSGASAGHCVSRAYRLAHDITALELAPCQLPVGLKDGRDGLTKALAALLRALALGIGSRQLLDVTDPPLPMSLEDGREGSRRKP
jgi:hypothetical protein